MKLVPFHKNELTLDTHFMVSDEDFDRVKDFKWRVDNNKPDHQAPHYRIIRTATKEEKDLGYPGTIKLHRFIFDLKDPKILVDHRNNWLDNTREALRLTDNKSNSRYSKRRDHKSNQYPKGVYVNKNNKKRSFYSTITVNGKSIGLGSFYTPEEAHEAYKQAAIKYFGEFAKFE